MDRYTLSFTDPSKLLVNFAWLAFDHVLIDYNTELKTNFSETEDVFTSTCMDPY